MAKDITKFLTPLTFEGKPVKINNKPHYFKKRYESIKKLYYD